MGSGEAGITLESLERKWGRWPGKKGKEKNGKERGERGEGQLSLIPVLINVGSILTPVLCTPLSSSLAPVHLSSVSGVSEFAHVHLSMSVETIKGPKKVKNAASVFAESQKPW